MTVPETGFNNVGLLGFAIGVPPAKKVINPEGPLAKLVVVKVDVSVTAVPSGTVAALEVTVSVGLALETVIVVVGELLGLKLAFPPYCATMGWLPGEKVEKPVGVVAVPSLLRVEVPPKKLKLLSRKFRVPLGVPIPEVPATSARK